MLGWHLQISNQEILLKTSSLLLHLKNVLESFADAAIVANLKKKYSKRKFYLLILHRIRIVSYGRIMIPNSCFSEESSVLPLQSLSSLDVRHTIEHFWAFQLQLFVFYSWFILKIAYVLIVWIRNKKQDI